MNILLRFLQIVHLACSSVAVVNVYHMQLDVMITLNAEMAVMNWTVQVTYKSTIIVDTWGILI